MEFQVLLLGNDINAYYMARNFHEEYGIKSYIIGRVPMLFTSTSEIVNVEIFPELLDEDKFVNKLIDKAKEINSKKIILVGCNDDYVSFIIKYKEKLSKYYLFNYTNNDLLDKLVNKEMFYKNFKDSGFDFPKTYFYDTKKELLETDIALFKYPVIVKPSNVVMYHECDFPGQAKVYKLDKFSDVVNTCNEIIKAGYTDKLIIQEFIPGDDHNLFDCVFYVNSKKKIWLQSFGQIGLQEHTSTGIGNLTVVINGYNEYRNTEKIKNKLKDFLQDIEFNGICEFDLKYDVRDKKFKVFEINPRQARSSYYLTGCGYNLAKYLVDDLIYNKEHDFVFISEKVALSFVPDYVVKKYIMSREYKQEFFKLKKNKKFVDPLRYDKDMNFERRKWLFKRSINYIRKYKNNKW
ncbi:MAG: carboxylate--amine ligase [bacterium]|nr:carboxylate--amine ligase [bacterium]